MFNKTSEAFLLLSLTLGAFAAAQEPPSLNLGTVDHLRSEALQEERRINVLLPKGYEGSTDRYPVVFLLDGSAHEDWFHVASLIDFFATYDVMPRTVVIGISNVDRRRDFTPPSQDEKDRAGSPTSGGAERFVTFLEKELLPYVAAHYRTNGTTTLIGQSLGGLLATKVLLEKPALFNNYVIVSPSLWWNRQALLKEAAERMKATPTPGRQVYLSVSNEHAEMKETAQKLAEIVKASGWPELRTRYDYFDGENHATSLHISVYQALKFFAEKK